MVTTTHQRRLRVLIVDDDRDLTTVLQKAFSVCGQNAIVANDGLRAIELARKLPIDVIMCDLEMPDMDGYTLAQKLREDPTVPYYPICAFTGRADEACRRQAVASGFEGFIVKTARFPEVLDFLRRYQR
jgi:two-component system, chemotaxis family, sensor kinase CheA